MPLAPVDDFLQAGQDLLQFVHARSLILQFPPKPGFGRIGRGLAGAPDEAGVPFIDPSPGLANRQAHGDARAQSQLGVTSGAY